jgi:hypothetical protein
VAPAICADAPRSRSGCGSATPRTRPSSPTCSLTSRPEGSTPAGGILFVIDGAKALAAGVRKVFGGHALIQRCPFHKRRNATDHLARNQRSFLDLKLAGAFNNPDPVAGLRAAKELATLLEDRHPDAAASLREGLEDMFTVRRLGLSGRLCRTLANTNTVESMICVAKTTTPNVKRWRDGNMIKRGAAAGMLNAERSRPAQQGGPRRTAPTAKLQPGPSPNFDNGRDVLHRQPLLDRLQSLIVARLCFPRHAAITRLDQWPRRHRDFRSQ